MTSRSVIYLDYDNILTATVPVKQGDSGRVIEARIVKNGSAVDLTGASAVFNAKKPDGTVVVTDSLSVHSAGIIMVSVPAATFAKAGKVTAELEITSSTGRISTFNFFFEVQKKPVQGGEISEDYINVLTNLISQANAILTQAQTAARNAEQSAQDAEAAAESVDSEAIIGEAKTYTDGQITSLRDDVSNTYVPETRTVNSKALSSDITLDASDVGAVPTTRTVNGKALSSDVNITRDNIAGIVASSDGSSKILNMSLSGSTLTITFAGYNPIGV